MLQGQRNTTEELEERVEVLEEGVEVLEERVEVLEVTVALLEGDINRVDEDIDSLQIETGVLTINLEGNTKTPSSLKIISFIAKNKSNAVITKCDLVCQSKKVDIALKLQIEIEIDLITQFYSSVVIVTSMRFTL